MCLVHSGVMELAHSGSQDAVVKHGHYERLNNINVQRNNTKSKDNKYSKLIIPQLFPPHFTITMRLRLCTSVVFTGCKYHTMVYTVPNSACSDVTLTA